MFYYYIREYESNSYTYIQTIYVLLEADIDWVMAVFFYSPFLLISQKWSVEEKNFKKCILLFEIFSNS